MKLISVILPVYNSQKTIANTIKSVLKQKYSSFELIIVDDGSTDLTYSICKKYTNDNRIKVFKNPNKGVSSARNYGIEKASGEKICFIDSDDEYLEDFLENLEKYCDSYQLVVCGYNMVNQYGEKKVTIEDFKSEEKKTIFEKLYSNLLFNQVWNKMYDTKIIRQNNILFDEKISIAEDWKFVIEYWKICKNVYFCNKCLYNYSLSENGLGFSFKNEANDIKIKLLEEIESVYIDENVDLEYIYVNYIKQMYAYISNLLDSRNKNSLGNRITNIKKFMFDDSYNTIMKKTLAVRNFKYRCLSYILNQRNIGIILILGMLANKYDRLHKRKIFKGI